MQAWKDAACREDGDQNCTKCIDRDVTSGLPLALIPKLRLLPGKGRVRNLVMWVPVPVVMCCGHLVRD